MKLEADPTQVATAPLDFDDFFRDQYGAVARAAALVVRDADLGLDLAQEAFARTYERWADMVSADHARNFVFRVAINLGRSQLRRTRAFPAGLVGGRATVDDQTASMTEWIVVSNALGRLSPRQRQCVVLTDYVDLDAGTIASILGIATDTVRVHLMRGRATLRTHLSLIEEPEP